MAYFQTAKPAPFGAITVHTAIAMIDRGVRSLKTWVVAQRTQSELRQLSDQQLADLGLSRGMIEDFSSAFSAGR